MRTNTPHNSKSTRETTSKKSKSSNRARIIFRGAFIYGVLILFSSFIVAKLFSTTVIHAEDWNAKANETFNKIDTIQPIRGDILACDGTVLVTNLQFYNIRIDFGSEAFAKKTFIDSIGALCDSLGKYYPRNDDATWNDVLMKQFSAKKKNRSFKLLSRITY